MGSFSFGSVFFVDPKKMNSAGGPKPAGCDLTVSFREKRKSRSRGCAPARRLHFFVRPKKRSKEMRPNSLPFGFPPFRSVLQLRKNSPDGSNSFLRNPAKLHCTAAASHGMVGSTGYGIVLLFDVISVSVFPSPLASAELIVLRRFPRSGRNHRGRFLLVAFSLSIQRK